MVRYVIPLELAEDDHTKSNRELHDHRSARGPLVAGEAHRPQSVVNDVCADPGA